jgi:hypothetical protein
MAASQRGQTCNGGQRGPNMFHVKMDDFVAAVASRERVAELNH